jgi:hypothetical protein
LSERIHHQTRCEQSYSRFHEREFSTGERKRKREDRSGVEQKEQKRTKICLFVAFVCFGSTSGSSVLVVKSSPLFTPRGEAMLRARLAA